LLSASPLAHALLGFPQLQHTRQHSLSIPIDCPYLPVKLLHSLADPSVDLITPPFSLAKSSATTTDTTQRTRNMVRIDGTNTPSTSVKTALNDLDDRRIKNIRPLIPPQMCVPFFLP
jgi:hypothetical protein